TSLVFLVLLSGFATAPGQTREHKPLPTEELEKYDNPPALLWRTGQSPRMVSQFNAFTSFQVNVDAAGHNITGDAANEPSITIDNTSSIGHGFQYQHWSSSGNNFSGRQFTRSIDGGITWLNPVNIPNSPSWGTPDVNTDGTLYIGGVNLGTGQIWCERSTNAK